MPFYQYIRDMKWAREHRLGRQAFSEWRRQVGGELGRETAAEGDGAGENGMLRPREEP